MNTRLKHFLDAENISQSQFADTIKVVRASVSHVLSGRNNPSYEFMKAIMTSYPQLNMEWLMLGKGKMYKSAQADLSPSPTPVSDRPSGLLFEDEEAEQPTFHTSSVQESNNPLLSPVFTESTQTSSAINTLKETTQSIIKQRNVSKIIVMFDDGTFQEM